MTEQDIDKQKTKAWKIREFILRHELILAALLAIAVIIIGSVMGIENNKIITGNAKELVRSTTNSLSFLSNWDGVRYISISQHGYNDKFLTGWFPLYPGLIFLLNKVIGSALMSALLISWVCLAGAIYYYAKIIKLYFKVNDNLDALKATLFFVLFPSGVYLLAAYTESLFALLSLAAIYYALKKKYIRTALLSMLATATHINGMFILLFVVLILIEEKERIRNVIITLVVGSLGLISYMTYLLIAYHNPFEFVEAQRNHHWLRGSIISQIGNFGWIDYSLAIVILLTVIYWWNRRKSFAIYSALYLLIPLIGGQFGGYPRYALMAFPLQFMIIDWARKKEFAYTVLLIISGLAWTYLLLQYAAGYVIS
jgi:Gpi18-like mannosyltransferase